MAEIRLTEDDEENWRAQVEREQRQMRKADAPPKKVNGNGATPHYDNRPILTSSEFVGGFKPPAYILDGILQRGFCYSLTALTGSGKTALTLLLMAHIALGRSLNGRDVEQGRVLMLAGENADDVRMRWIALSEAMGFDPDEIDVHFMPGVFSIRDSMADIKLRAEFLGGFAFISVDTSAAYFAGEDENSNKELGDHARMLRELTLLPGNPAILANCHPVKNAASDNLLPRGGGAFLNEVDGNLCCSKSDSVVELHWQGKFRGPEFDPVHFELVQHMSPVLLDHRGRQIPTIYARTLSKIEQDRRETNTEADMLVMMKLIAEDGYSTLEKFAVRAEWKMGNGEPNKMKVHRVLKNLKRERLVNQHLNLWQLTSAGEKIKAAVEGLS